MNLLKLIVSLSLFIFSFTNLYAQDSAHTKKIKLKITEESVVMDTSGSLLPYVVWKSLLGSGEFGIRPVTPGTTETAFIVYPLSEEEKVKRTEAITNLPKPRESNSFRTGEHFFKLKSGDINGNTINTKELKGKVIVLNFWFINCPPCRKEIPELNELVETYKNDSAIIFIAVALDEISDIRDFLKTNPFNYKIIDNGKNLARDYGIKSYPTNVVIDKNSKVYFHTVGYAPNTVLWIKKSIEEIKNQPEIQ